MANTAVQQFKVKHLKPLRIEVRNASLELSIGLKRTFGNRSPAHAGLREEGRTRESHESGLHEFGEKMEWVLTLKLAGPCHGKNPLGEAFPGLGLVPETEFSPLDRWPDRLFGGIVGRFDSLMSEDSEKMVPVNEQSFGSGPYVSIRAGQVF